MAVSFQIRMEREAADRRIRARCQIPVDSSWFQGHFPANPIFPAVGLLGLLDQAMALGEGSADLSLPSRLYKRVRFRQIVRPGETLRIDILPEDTEEQSQFRFNIFKETELVSEGMVALNPSVWDDIPRETEPFRVAERAEVPIEEIVPHRDLMRLVDTFYGQDEMKRGITRTVVKETWPLCNGSYVSSTIMIELVAQATAATAGWEDAKKGKGKGVGFGYIVGIKQARLSGDPIPVGTALTIITRKTASQDNYGVFSGEVIRDNRVGGEVVVQVLRPE